MKKLFKMKTGRLLSLALTFAITASLAACASPEEAKNAAQGAANGAAASAASSSGSSAGTKISVPKDAPWKSRDNKPVTVRAGFAKGMTGIANQFAIENGWYEDAGITIDELDIPNPVSAFGAGEVDIADGDPGTYIPAIVNKVPIRIVSNMWRSKGAYWIIAKPEIKTWADLKGKKFGTAQATGGMKMTSLEVLTKNGVDINKDIEQVANGFYQTGYATLTSGNVDATIIHQPYATIAKKAGYTVLGKTWEYMPAYNTGVLVATDKMLSEQPDVVKRVLEVYYYANDYAKNHLDEFLPWASKYLNIDQDVAREAIESEIELWENDPVVQPERLQATEDLLKKYGMQKQAYPVDNVYDNKIADEVARELKLGKYASGN